MRALDSGEKDDIRQRVAEQCGDGTPWEDWLVGEVEVVAHQDSRSNSDQQKLVEVNGTITTLAKFKTRAPSERRAKRALTVSNTKVSTPTWATSSFLVSFHYDRVSKQLFDMTEVGSYELLNNPGHFIPIISKNNWNKGWATHELLRYAAQVSAGSQQASWGIAGAKFGNLPPKDGKKSRGRPTKVNPGY